MFRLYILLRLWIYNDITRSFVWDHYSNKRASGLLIIMQQAQWIVDDIIFITNCAQILFHYQMGGFNQSQNSSLLPEKLNNKK